MWGCCVSLTVLGFHVQVKPKNKLEYGNLELVIQSNKGDGKTLCITKLPLSLTYFCLSSSDPD